MSKGRPSLSFFRPSNISNLQIKQQIFTFVKPDLEIIIEIVASKFFDSLTSLLFSLLLQLHLYKLLGNGIYNITVHHFIIFIIVVLCLYELLAALRKGDFSFKLQT